MARWLIARKPENACESELVAYRALSQLGEDWTVRWHYHYLDGSTPREGDFLILGPDGRLLVMEVKNRVRTHWGTGRTDDPAGVGRGEEPEDQLLAQKKGVIRALQKEHESHPREREIPFVFAALFYAQGDHFSPCTHSNPIPAISGPSRLQRLPDLWNQLSAGARPSASRECVAKLFEDTYGSQASGGGGAVFISATDRLLIERAATDFSLLEAAGENRQILVTGGPGSGKTWMAERHAIQLAERGARVLFLCYNKALGAQFEREIPRLLKMGSREIKGSITVQTWESLADHLAGELPPDTLPEKPPISASKEVLERYYETDLPDAMLDAVTDKKFRPPYDALVVDEAQDHNTDWWEIYFALLAEGNRSRIGIYGDPAQRPSFRLGQFDLREVAGKLSQPAFLRLTETRRFTRPIYRYLQTIVSEPTQKLVDGLSTRGLLAGPEVVIGAKARDWNECKTEAGEQIKSWFEEGLADPCDLLLLAPSDPFSGKKSIFAEGEPWLGCKVVRGDSPDAFAKGTIKATSFYKSKGLDARAVILLNTPAWEDLSGDDKKIGYWLAASRARQLLAIFPMAPSPS